MSVSLERLVLNLDTLGIWGQVTLCCGTTLCIVECLAASLASAN